MLNIVLRLVRRGICCCVIVVWALVSAQNLAAQQIELVSPTRAQHYAEAPDFASTELDNPWDFVERRDIGFEVGYVGGSVGVQAAPTDGGGQGSHWVGQAAETGAYVFPLFGGYSGSLFAEAPQGDRTLPRLGANHPIDASQYYYLSIRSQVSHRSSYALYWNSKPEVSLFPDGSQGGASFDGFYAGSATPNAGFQIYSFDMRSGSFEQRFGSWSGDIAALRFDPSIAGPPGTRSEIDWIRLVDPQSAPMIDLRWQSSSLPANALVTVYLDSDSHGYNGTPLARFVSQGGRQSSSPYFTSHPSLARDTGSLQYPSAALPAGTYHFYLKVEVVEAGRLKEITRSAYSAPIEILAAPRAYFTAPSVRSGKDYAASERGDAWDMQEHSDVANALPGSFHQELRQFSHFSIQNGVFQASADAPLPGNQESDAQLSLAIPSNKAIDAQRYRYLTYRMGADETLYPSIEDKVRRGWVTRPVFWDGDLFAKGGSFKAHVLYEGMKTYTIDLWDDSQVERGLGWKGVGRISRMRLDPLETDVPTWFFVDWIELRAENAPDDEGYTFRWVIEDPNSRTLSYSLFLDTDAEGENGVLLATKKGVSGGEHSFHFSTKGLAPGRYYPYVQIDNGGNSRIVYSDVPLVVGASPQKAWRTKRFDYDGDGISDASIYRPGAQLGSFYVQSSSSAPLVRQWGLASYQPIEGDFDGDRKSDIGVVADLNGMLHWFIIRSSDGGLYYRMWGQSGDVVAIADYDADDKDEIAVYRAGAWFVLNENNTAMVAHWGEQGDVPVPADFDGDGRADFAIWRPRDGTWWIIASGFASGETSEQYLVRQWGLPGDQPLVADFDGDQKSDFLVWRPSNGTWYLRFSSAEYAEHWQWGLPGDVPLLGHFLTSNEPNFSVWRESSGQWFHRSRAGTIGVQQWGLPRDVIAKRLGHAVR